MGQGHRPNGPSSSMTGGFDAGKLIAEATRRVATILPGKVPTAPPTMPSLPEPTSTAASLSAAWVTIFLMLAGAAVFLIRQDWLRRSLPAAASDKRTTVSSATFYSGVRTETPHIAKTTVGKSYVNVPTDGGMDASFVDVAEEFPNVAS